MEGKDMSRVSKNRQKTESRQEKQMIREMVGIAEEECGNYFIQLIERDRVLEKKLNIIHNPEIIYICLKNAMNGLEFNCLHISEVKRLILGVFYYNS